MKSIYLLLPLFFFAVFTSYSQVTYTFLEHNNVSAYISNMGTYFWNNESSPVIRYEVPKGSGHNMIFTSEFWFAVKDAADSIHMTQGGFENVKDIFNGPISIPGSYDTPEYQDIWEQKIWQICQADIDNFKLIWQCNNGLITVGCDDIPPLSQEVLDNIYSWPAHGDVTKGQSYYLAPFYDYNSDGSYNPDDGDYPIIKGCCATYMIKNDAAFPHNYTSTAPIGMELHLMFYQYLTADYLKDITFVDLLAINKSGTDYPEIAHSIYLDADVGFYGDDFYGCDSTNNVIYFYNADNDDQEFNPFLGYGINPPAFGVVSLEQDLTASAVVEIGTSAIDEKWNVMNGLQFFGTPWLNQSGQPTNFLYSGNPNDVSSWNELNAMNPPGDVNGIASVKKNNFNNGDTLKLSYAFLYARDGNHIENVQSIIDMAAAVKVFYDNESDVACNGATWNVSEQDAFQINIMPNPSYGKFQVNTFHYQIDEVNVKNASGQLIKRMTPICTEQMELDLTGEQSGIYFLELKSESRIVVKKIVVQ